MEILEKNRSEIPQLRLNLLRAIGQWNKAEKTNYERMGYDFAQLSADQVVDTREKAEALIDYVFDPVKREQDKNSNIRAMQAEIFMEWAEANGVELPADAYRKEKRIAA